MDGSAPKQRYNGPRGKVIIAKTLMFSQKSKCVVSSIVNFTLDAVYKVKHYFYKFVMFVRNIYRT